MTSVLYQEFYARAQELRLRLERMRQWFELNQTNAAAEELHWRQERFDAAKKEYDELVQVMRAYGKGEAVAVNEHGMADIEE